MLTKLLKYDLKWIYKVVIVFYILTLIFAVIGRCLVSIDNSLIFNIVGKISIGIAISMAVSALINTLMRSWARFIKNIYKEEGYLTNTLPIDKKTIYLSKVLSALIVTFTTVVIILLTLFICYYSKENIEVLRKALDIVSMSYETKTVYLLLIMGFVFFMEMLFVVLIGYVGIILGHKSNNKKLAKSIIFAILIYLALQTLTLLIVFLLGLINPSIMNLINTNEMIDIGTIKSIMYIGIIIYLVYITIFYCIGKKELEKGINI